MQKEHQVWPEGDVWAELLSWIRYGWAYKLPRWLSRPFHHAWVRWLYGLILAVMLVSFVPGEWQSLLLRGLQDLFKTIGLESPGAAIQSWFASLPAGWRPVLAGLLLAWGASVLFWAWKQDRFFRALAEAGAGVIRGPGTRFAFLDRLQRQGARALGLGPTGKLLSPYMERRQDRRLRRKMKELESKRGKVYGVLITGDPSSGKTRTAMELIADLRPAFVLSWSQAVRATPSFPGWNGKGLVFFDNLEKAAGEGSFLLPANLLYLLEEAPGLLLVGTVRPQHLSEDTCRAAVFKLSHMDGGQPGLSGFLQFIAERERAGGLETSVEEVRQRFNGHPGGPVAGVKTMAVIYNELSSKQKAPLRGIKLLRRMGVRHLSRARVEEAAELVQAEKYQGTAFQAVLEDLNKKGLISWRPGEGALEVYEVYLEQVVDLPGELLDLRQSILQCWKERGDADAFVDAADALNDPQGRSDPHGPRTVLLEAISLYKEAMAFHTEERSPLDYARTQNNLGTAYQNLARHKQAEENLENAIQAYGQALRFRTEECAPLEYAHTQNNLGTAYQNLARHQQPEENLEKAIQAFSQALRFYTEEQAPLDYGRIHNNLGIAYQDLAGYQKTREKLEKAIRAYSEALRFFTEARAPLSYAMIQNNLGAVYEVLAEQADSEENMEKAIHAYTEALRLFSPEQAIGHHAKVRDKLRRECYRLGLWFRTKSRPEEAIAQFEKAMQLSATIGSALHLAGIYKQKGKSIPFMKYIYTARRIIAADDWYNLACIESLMGNQELAFEHLRRAAGQERMDRNWAWVDPDFEELRTDPRFEEIVGPREVRAH